MPGTAPESRRSARTSAASPSEPRAACTRSRSHPCEPLPAGGQAQRAGERLAPVGEAAGHERAQRPRLGPPAGAGAAADQPHQHRVDVGHRVEDGARDRPHARAPRRRAGRAPRAARRRRCPGRRRAARRPRAGPSPPTAPTAGSSWSVRSSDARGDPVGEVGHDLGRRGLERAQVEPHRVAPAQRHVRAARRRPASASRSRSSISTTCTWRDALGEVLAEHAQATADLEHHVLGDERAARADHAEDVGVDQEVLPELAVGAHARSAAGAAGSAARAPAPAGSSPAEQPRGVAAPRPGRAAPRPTPRAARPGSAAVWATKAGWLRCLRTDLRGQVGGVGLDQQAVLLARAPRPPRARAALG